MYVYQELAQFLRAISLCFMLLGFMLLGFMLLGFMLLGIVLLGFISVQRFRGRLYHICLLGISVHYIEARVRKSLVHCEILAVAILWGGALASSTFAQVPGICTAPDGSAWLEVPAILEDSTLGLEPNNNNSPGYGTSTRPLPPIPTSSPSSGIGSEHLTSEKALGTTGALRADESRKADEALLRRWLAERQQIANASSPSSSGHTTQSPQVHPSFTPEIAHRLGFDPQSTHGAGSAWGGAHAPSNNTSGIPASTVSNVKPVNLYAPHASGVAASGSPIQNTGMHQSMAPHSFSPHSQGGNSQNPHSYNPQTYNPHRQASAKLAQGDDDLLGGNQSLVPDSSAGDPLSGMGPDAAREKERAQSNTANKPPEYPPGVDPHWEVFANDRYPSAIKCAKCHQQIYDEWRVSAHAYSAISPMFNRFEQKITELTRGTVGTFCMRCHAPVATQMDFPRDAPMFQGSAVFREGITCIACHRVVERYGRVNGERRIEPGSEFDPVVGNLGGDGIQAVLADRDNYKVKTDPNDKRPFQPIHQGAIQFEQLSDSSFCAGCHQVVVQPGIALEIVYQQYRQGPACKKGVSCQDCHMGAVPGKALGYTESAAAVVNEKAVNTTRKHANHVFYGPSMPLAHPGLFPHNEKSLRWSPDVWLQFDHRQGWGTDSFENALRNGTIAVSFPEAWKNAQERRDARKVLDENQKLLDYKRKTAVQVLENGSRIDGPFFNGTPAPGKDLGFHYVVTNTSEGHNMPSGSLGAQPQLWLNVVLIGPDGQRLWESGDLDSNGDLRDLHSLDVRAKKIQRDAQLVNFQTKFLITNAKGTEREMYLPVNVDIDPLPFFRPGTVPYTVLNHPPLIRMEAHSIPPLDSRVAKYSIPSHLIKAPGTYRLSVRMRSRVEPPYFLLFCDGTPEMLTALNESILDVHPYSTEFIVR